MKFQGSAKTLLIIIIHLQVLNARCLAPPEFCRKTQIKNHKDVSIITANDTHALSHMRWNCKYHITHTDILPE